ncbi:luciferin sulfotransferase-like [Belonocnema kinseyi]|uniref:luciferin sulfotransferase-like n=1 Tax=Belonocnema kinseyi TaxID=2817044 RepID=UPI00143DD116|nr:luciferin sulfotransferase-like [Belonocnema kinseyi]
MSQKFIIPADDLDRLLQEKCTSELRTGYITVDGVCLPEYFQNFADRVENFEVRDDDIWVCSFPKTGTTWTQEMVWCLANDLDFERGKVILQERFPFLELTSLWDYRNVIQRRPDLVKPHEFIFDSFNFVNKLPSPRFIKTHLPFHLLPKEIRTGEKKPKIIYVSRNVKDTCVSYFHHCQLFEEFSGTFEEFCRLFLAGKVYFGSFWKHVSGFWERRMQGNMLFLQYEEMKADLQSVIKETAKFLGKKELSESEIKILEKHLSFTCMKANPAVNFEEIIEIQKRLKLTTNEGKFIRSGKVNQWKESMSKEMINRFDSWTEDVPKGYKTCAQRFKFDITQYEYMPITAFVYSTESGSELHDTEKKLYYPLRGKERTEVQKKLEHIMLM